MPLSHVMTVAEAWNNLSSSLAKRNQWDAAIEAVRAALRLSPEYADAHYNLAVSLHAAGRQAEARAHARRYLATDPASEWAALLRSTLGL